ncbi:ribosome small subunit-dependent GTPase A [bacterium]|nr:ribosome small subunit-dependent GTPase A [bacterium]
MAKTGIITKRIKGFYYLLTDEGETIECKAKGLLFKNSRFDNQIAVGDRVSFLFSEKDDVGLITGIENRRSFLSRNRVGIEVEQVIAANVDNLLIVASTQKPPFRTNLINRLLVAAKAGNVKPTIVITKTDLSSPKEIEALIDPYKDIQCDIIFSTTKSAENDQRLLDIFHDSVSVLTGQSGVGKSSLLNKLFPNLNIKVGAVSDKTSKGSHTTTFAAMHKIAENSYIIDTPGIREFGLWNLDNKNLAQFYPIICDFSYQCKHRNCQHIQEPNCAVQEAVKNGKIHKKLYQGYVSIHDSLKNS